MTRSGIIFAVGAAALGIGLAAPRAQAQVSGASIRQQIIKASIESYPGACPCPYNTDRAGRRYGGRSAHSRPGGYPPKCYPSDVTAEEVKALRARG